MTYTPPVPSPVPFVGCAPRLVPDDVRACCAGIGTVGTETPVDDATVGAAIDEVLYLFDLATDFAFRGVCSATIRPCRVAGLTSWGRFIAEGLVNQYWPSSLPIPGVSLGGLDPIFVGSWPCSCAGDSCACTTLGALRLPYLPVVDVTNMTIDGADLAASEYRLIPGTNVLVRTDGTAWPTAQDVTLEASEVGTWSITFSFGFALPPGVGRRIAGYACEVARACAGLPCQLPEGVRIQSRGDQTYVVFDKYRDEGLTGYPPLDDWIVAQRGGRARIRPSMTRPRHRNRAAFRET